jgi:hypothetical protein
MPSKIYRVDVVLFRSHQGVFLAQSIYKFEGASHHQVAFVPCQLARAPRVISCCSWRVFASAAFSRHFDWQSPCTLNLHSNMISEGESRVCSFAALGSLQENWFGPLHVEAPLLGELRDPGCELLLITGLDHLKSVGVGRGEPGPTIVLARHGHDSGIIGEHMVVHLVVAVQVVLLLILVQLVDQVEWAPIVLVSLLQKGGLGTPQLEHVGHSFLGVSVLRLRRIDN